MAQNGDPKSLAVLIDNTSARYAHAIFEEIVIARRGQRAAHLR